MFSFIMDQHENMNNTENFQQLEDELTSAEAIQGDVGLILRVNELNALREFKEEVAA